MEMCKYLSASCEWCRYLKYLQGFMNSKFQYVLHKQDSIHPCMNIYYFGPLIGCICYWLFARLTHQQLAAPELIKVLGLWLCVSGKYIFWAIKMVGERDIHWDTHFSWLNLHLWQFSWSTQFIPSTLGIWNLLPRYILESDTITVFKSTLQSYYYEINS